MEGKFSFLGIRYTFSPKYEGGKRGFKLRKYLSFLLVLLLSCSLMAQIRTGNIYGKVVDEEGNPLPGVNVTLTGTLTAPVTAVTSAEGTFRFLALSPANDYAVRLELEGFKSLSRGGIVVALGRNTEIQLTMELGTIEEEITVTAASPVVESRRITIAENVTWDILQSLPSARDPWVVLQQAPGVMVDRENIGGSESGQQAGFFAKGGGQPQWNLDGVVITDPAAVASPTYYDFDAFDEMQITTGGADVTIQGGGVNINLVTRRGGNRVSLGGRFYFTDSKFQSKHTGENIDKILTRYPNGVGYNVVNNIKDYGFNMGGPLFTDKVWWWMSYGVQDIKTNVITGARDDTLLQNYAGKINLQLLPQNRMELFTHVGNKEKFGRSAAHHFPGGWHQTGKYHFGSPIWKVQDEHMFGDSLFVSAKWSFNDSGFNLIPMDDENLEKLLAIDLKTGIYHNSFFYYHASRPSHSFYLQANYFNDTLLGASHELKIGFDWRRSKGAHTYTSAGNVLRYYNYYERGYRTIDIDGDNIPDLVPGIQQIYLWRGSQYDNHVVTGYAGYFSDTITVGRFNLLLGFRYDRQVPTIEAFDIEAVDTDNPAWTDNMSSATITGIDRFLPGLKIPDVDPKWSMDVFSPRLGITFDVFGDQKTIAKVSFSRYGEFMSTGWGDYWAPTGIEGWLRLWWMDNNGNGIVDVTELYWDYPNDRSAHQVFDSSGNIIADVSAAQEFRWGGYDYFNPQATGTPRFTVDDSVGSYYINEVLVTLEREILPDFGAALDFTYRKFTNSNWNLRWDGSDKSTIESKDTYVQAGTVPSHVGPISMKEAAGKPYYLWKAGYFNYYFRYLTQRPDFYQDYMGLELRLTKRMSNKWMMNASATLQTEKVHFGDRGYLDPQNIWAHDNRIYAPSMGGGSGKISMRVFSHWLVKLSGLYQLPLDFNISFAFNARQGHVLHENVTFVDYSAPNPRDQAVDVDLDYFGKLRLPVFWNLNLRAEKLIRVADTGKIYIMADLFNAFNQSHENRRYDPYHGTYYAHDQRLATNPTDNLINEVLNPRIIRLGVRFQF